MTRGGGRSTGRRVRQDRLRHLRRGAKCVWLGPRTLLHVGRVSPRVRSPPWHKDTGGPTTLSHLESCRDPTRSFTEVGPPGTRPREGHEVKGMDILVWVGYVNQQLLLLDHGRPTTVTEQGPPLNTVYDTRDNNEKEEDKQ